MNDSNLKSLDMSALLVFDALLEEGSVTGAAQRLGLTQSAVSHALKRLRDLWHDPLFVRRAGRMAPTQRALALAPGLTRALGELRAVVGEADRFDPARSRRRFVLGMSDYAASLFLPPLLARAAGDLDRLTFLARHTSHAIGLEMLDRGEVECVIGSFPPPPSRMREAVLLEEDFVCAARAGHPLFQDGAVFDLAAYAGARHVNVSLAGEPAGLPDRFLARRGLTRHIVLGIGHFLLLPQVLASSDLVATEPRTVLAPFLDGFGITTRPPPFATDRFTFSMIWQARSDRDAALHWLRDQIQAIAAAETARRRDRQ